MPVEELHDGLSEGGSTILGPGVLQIRDAIKYVGSRRNVTRFSVYNYLNELER